MKKLLFVFLFLIPISLLSQIPLDSTDLLGYWDFSVTESENSKICSFTGDGFLTDFETGGKSKYALVNNVLIFFDYKNRPMWIYTVSPSSDKKTIQLKEIAPQKLRNANMTFVFRSKLSDKPAKPATKRPIEGSTTGTLSPKKEKGSNDSNQSGEKNGDKSSDSNQSGRTKGTAGGGLSGRAVIKSIKVQNTTSHFGTVVMKVCVNPKGDVIEAVFTQRGSTTANNNLTKKAEEAAKKYKFKANPYAPNKQCGTITFRFLPS